MSDQIPMQNRMNEKKRTNCGKELDLVDKSSFKKETRMVFEIGKCYKHATGLQIHVIGEVETNA